MCYLYEENLKGASISKEMSLSKLSEARLYHYHLGQMLDSVSLLVAP
jgi:hypothetical protein